MSANQRLNIVYIKHCFLIQLKIAQKDKQFLIHHIKLNMNLRLQNSVLLLKM